MKHQLILLIQILADHETSDDTINSRYEVTMKHQLILLIQILADHETSDDTINSRY